MSEKPGSPAIGNAAPLVGERFITHFVALLAAAGLALSFFLLLVSMSMFPGFNLINDTLSRLGRQSFACDAEAYLGQPIFNAAYVLGSATLLPLYAVFARGSHVSGQKKARNAFCFLIIAACGLVGAGILTDEGITFRYHLSQSGTFFAAAAFACIFFIMEWWVDGRGARKWAIAYLAFFSSNVTIWIAGSSDAAASLGLNDGIPEFFSFVSFYIMNAAFIAAMLARGPAIPMVTRPRNHVAEWRERNREKR